MTNLKNKARGGILAMTLIIMTLLLMMAGAFLLSGGRAGFLTTEDHRGTQCRALAKSAVNRLVEQLQFDPAYATDLTWLDPSGAKAYEVTFDDTRPFVSTNNIAGDAATVSLYDGGVVPPHTAEILVSARSDTSTARYKFVLQRGFSLFGVVGANGAINFGDDVNLTSVTSLADPTPSNYLIVSNSSSQGVTYDDSGTFTISDEGKITSAGTIHPTIKSAMASSNNWQENSPVQTLPELPISSLVTQHTSDPAPVLNSSGTAVIRNDSYVSGNYVVNGQVNLGDASLYVDGDLTINGGVSGNGSIYATGNVTMAGGNASVHTNAQSGAAVFAGGDLNFTGLSATGLLDALAASDPVVDQAWNEFQDQYNMAASMMAQPSASYVRPANFETVFGSVPDWIGDPGHSNGVLFAQYPQMRDFFWAKHVLGAGISGTTTPLAKPGPAGFHSYAREGSTTREVWEAIQAQPGFGTDPRLDHLVTAFDDISYTFRHDWIGGSGGAWDAPVPPYTERDVSFDHAAWLVFGVPDPRAVQNQIPPDYTPSYAGALYQNEEGVRLKALELFDQNPPLDFSWLGKSYFQGVLYSRGELRIQNGASVMGGIIAGGDIHLLDGAEFTYNKEYEDLTKNLSGPVRVTSYSEL